MGLFLTIALVLNVALFLFNLIPLSPFDGGRITAVLSPRIWLLGVRVGALRRPDAALF